MNNNLENKQFHDYLIYSDGTVESLLTGKKITKRVGPKGYYQINLCINGKCKTFMFHRLMASVFIDNPHNLPCVNHIDGNKLNNTLSNLEWVTYRYNTLHALKIDLIHTARGKSTNNGRFEDFDIKEIRNLANNGMTQKEIADIYNVSKSAIQQIISRRTYDWVK